MKYRTGILIVLILILNSVGEAQFLENIAIHGFGGWAYGITDNENRYLVGNQDGNYDNINFSLNVSANLYENLRIYFQSAYNESFERKDVGLDYAFAEWYFSDLLSFRVGKVKAPYMIYTEIYDVGTLRPFYSLPQGIYHDFAAESYKGVGLTGNFFTKHDWEFSYDLYGGKLTVQPTRIPIFIYQQGEMNIVFANYKIEAEDFVGGRITARPPIDGLSISLASFTGDIWFNIEYENRIVYTENLEQYTFFGGSLEYLSDKWLLRSEYLQSKEDAEVTFYTGYFEMAYKFTKNWQLAFRQEFEDMKENFEHEDQDASQQDHSDSSLGLNYWFNPNFVLKFSFHRVEGNSFACPDKLEDYIESEINQEFEEETHLFLVGAQFSF